MTTSFRPKIGIGVPSQGLWKSGFGHSLALLMLRTGQWAARYPDETRPELDLIVMDGHLPFVRNDMVVQAQRDACSHLLWLDSDMTFPADALIHLLRHNLPIVGANYPRRVHPFEPTAHRSIDGSDFVWTEADSSGLEEVKHIGFGVCLMDMRVFETIEGPWFEMTSYRLGEGFQARGEDVLFMERLAQEAGIPVFVDHDLSRNVGHIGDMTFDHAHAIAARDFRPKAVIAEAAE